MHNRCIKVLVIIIDMYIGSYIIWSDSVTTWYEIQMYVMRSVIIIIIIINMWLEEIWYGMVFSNSGDWSKRNLSFLVNLSHNISLFFHIWCGKNCFWCISFLFFLHPKMFSFEYQPILSTQILNLICLQFLRYVKIPKYFRKINHLP